MAQKQDNFTLTDEDLNSVVAAMEPDSEGEGRDDEEEFEDLDTSDQGALVSDPEDDPASRIDEEELAEFLEWKKAKAINENPNIEKPAVEQPAQAPGDEGDVWAQRQAYWDAKRTADPYNEELYNTMQEQESFNLQLLVRQQADSMAPRVIDTVTAKLTELGVDDRAIAEAKQRLSQVDPLALASATDAQIQSTVYELYGQWAVTKPTSEPDVRRPIGNGLGGAPTGSEPAKARQLSREQEMEWSVVRATSYRHVTDSNELAKLKEEYFKS